MGNPITSRNSLSPALCWNTRPDTTIAPQRVSYFNFQRVISSSTFFLHLVEAGSLDSLHHAEFAITTARLLSMDDSLDTLCTILSSSSIRSRCCTFLTLAFPVTSFSRANPLRPRSRSDKCVVVCGVTTNWDKVYKILSSKVSYSHIVLRFEREPR